MGSKAITIEVDPASLQRMYRRIDPDGLIKDPMKHFVDRVAKDIEAKAINNAPEDTGKLKKSIRREKVKGGQAVIADTSYAAYVHEGTRPHWPPVQALAGWASRHGFDSPYPVAAAIAKHGTRAQPFLYDAAEQARRALPIELQVAVGSIESHWRSS